MIRPVASGFPRSQRLGPLSDRADVARLDATSHLDPARQAAMGQFLTPAPLARFMASMFRPRGGAIRLLDAGAGVGSLTAAFVEAELTRATKPTTLAATAYEVDPALSGYLRETLAGCEAECKEAGVPFTHEIRQADFIEAGALALGGDLFRSSEPEQFDCAILNPPYRKIRADSPERAFLRRIGVETTNLYSGFLSVVVRLLRDGGELVAITPRSFCNGPYFRSFRREFLSSMGLRRIHVFEHRDAAFGDDKVLQENVVFHAVKGKARPRVVVSASQGPEDTNGTVREADYSELVAPEDPDLFIRIQTDDMEQRIAERVARLPSSLADLGLEVSTGRVVDFRVRSALRQNLTPDAVPLVYPTHLSGGRVEWPREGGRKPNALAVTRATEGLLLDAGTYVLVKRFSAKEERRRVVASVCSPKDVPGDRVAFENHVNFFHREGRGLPPRVAAGLGAYLNSTLVDGFFRQFNGHTQVNATDLRSLRYPARGVLDSLGARVEDGLPGQVELDRLVEEVLFNMAEDKADPDPVRAKEKVAEALVALRDLGFPRQQLNDRSALVLLALLDLKADSSWADATAPLRGITPLMQHVATHFGRKYAPNTRETVRRQTIHQFVHAGLVVQNPDNPSRATNSKDNVYQVTPAALALLRALGSAGWANRLREYLGTVGTLSALYVKEREMRLIPVRVAAGKTINLTPGGQNVLVEKILHDFCPRFTPESRAVYVGDTGKKLAYFDADLLAELGVTIEQHGKMPDVVAYFEREGWLVLIEAVTAHGPVDPKRRLELKKLFKGCKAGLVFVTAFLDRATLVKYVRDIAWETEVWVAEAPSHLIHFNGERFLGPYEEA